MNPFRVDVPQADLDDLDQFTTDIDGQTVHFLHVRYERFGVHGNDAGALISPEVARLAPGRVLGVHVSGGLGIPSGADFAELTEDLPDLPAADIRRFFDTVAARA
ncbi:MAG TPA: hypothetical protein VGP26_25805 [Actinophytocola sp.]|nr:hypothetical protein [Actinophytocola sp.]